LKVNKIIYNSQITGKDGDDDDDEVDNVPLIILTKLFTY